MKVDTPGAPLDQFMRQNRNHHVQLSRMADSKANMLITISSLVVTFSVGYLDRQFLRWPAAVLIVFSVITLILAVYAVMPKVSLIRRKLPPADLDDPMFNILFFGDFLRLPFPKFRDEMEKVMQDPNTTYETMLREMYSMGYYLASNKFRYLRLAYGVFVAGMVGALLIIVVIGAITLNAP